MTQPSCRCERHRGRILIWCGPCRRVAVEALMAASGLQGQTWHILRRRQMPRWPAVPCVYAVYASGRLVYVGQTQNLRLRMYGHRSAGTLASFCALKFSIEPDADRRVWREYRLIRRLRPSLNTHYTRPRRPRMEAS